jgi:YVTN family beta-propeller protein
MKRYLSQTVRLTLLAAILLGSASGVRVGAAGAAAAPASYLSPTALAAAPDGKTLFVACATAKQVMVLDVASQKVTRTLNMPEAPLGLTLSADGAQLLVACAAPESKVCVVDVAKGKTVATLPAGHTAMAPVLSPDGKTLFVCNRFNDDVSFIDLATKKESRRVKVQREPVAAALTKDGKFLLVANLLHHGPADADYVAATVSVIDVAAGKVVKELRLPNGSGALNDLRVSPDGKYAVVTHILARFHLPTTQLERGWMNTNAKTLIDLDKLEVINTVLVDNVDSGAANPWGIAWSADSKTVVIAHAGTHEISVIDFPGLLAKLAKLPAKLEEGKTYDYLAASRVQADVPNDLSFLVGVRRRLKLPEADRGPRAVVLIGKTAYVANYFSDTIATVDITSEYPKWQSIALGPKKEMNTVRKGEFYFHDASICFQGWQSCSSCHPGDARVDGLNWDLLNDGIGNPKNNKSLLLAHKTPPAMSMGIRDSAEFAVRSGIKHILFTVQPDEVPNSLDEYLKSLKPVPSPYLVRGKLSKAAERGRKVFNQADCATCHPPPLFTSLEHYDVGSAGKYDRNDKEFDTPTLIEGWRTAPYLHDGSATTLRDVLTTHNPKDQHGKTSDLTRERMDDLVEYLLSL